MSRKREQPVQDTDITKSFLKSALEQMFAFYVESDDVTVSKVPRVKRTENAQDVKKETNQSFQSRLVDLRVRKAMDKAQERNSKKTSEVPDVIKNVETHTNDEEDNIPEIFQTEPAERAEVPRYVSASKKQEEMNQNVSNFRGRNMINWEKSRQEFGRRLQKSKMDGINRAKRRMERLQASARENDPSVRYYPNSTTSSCQSAYYQDDTVKTRRPLAQIENR